MSLFTSKREKRYWFFALLVLFTIITTLFVGQPLLKLLGNQDVQAFLFLAGMFLVGVAILTHALSIRPGNVEMAILLGIAAIYVMLFLRLGLPERSHLIEYSILTIFVHRALMERKLHRKKPTRPALWAGAIVFGIGVVDECIQLVLPDRVFDTDDILFNGIAVVLALSSTVLLQWIRKKITRKSS
ncbi:VanZ family protein [Aureisphaera galaxeae]|uniref:VanZ family protein n=1 Tax=Aureisphaera galaxeae TaxID=1538023 RepID=UPI002350E225|nr:VanZ family protein [Aureisphaera galaxeae]MDC8003218.1 VanZ family protein [Aureisphaera galaxeae]